MATEITVLSGVAAVPALKLAAAAFHRETGHAVTITANLPGPGTCVNQRLLDGEAFDVVVSTSDALELNYVPFGLVQAGGICIARTGVGIAARAGAPMPDISTMQAFRRALLEADAIIVTTHSSGVYAESMLKRIGMHEQVEAKLVRFSNGPLQMDRLLAGTGREFGFASISQIRLHQKMAIRLVGPLPDEVQRYSEFVAVPTTNPPHEELAWDFARFCGGAGNAYFSAL